MIKWSKIELVRATTYIYAWISEKFGTVVPWRIGMPFETFVNLHSLTSPSLPHPLPPKKEFFLTDVDSLLKRFTYPPPPGPPPGPLSTPPPPHFFFRLDFCQFVKNIHLSLSPPAPHPPTPWWVGVPFKECHLKHLFGYVEGQGHTWRSNDKMVKNWACPGHNFYIYAWISEEFGTVVPWRIGMPCETFVPLVTFTNHPPPPPSKKKKKKKDFFQQMWILC